MYGYLKNEAQTNYIFRHPLRKGISFIFVMLFKRLVRIMPLYLMVMLMSEVASTYFRETSIIEIDENYDYNCQNYWWRNLLFIQNFYPFRELCLCHSWSLACEWQYFIITTVIYVIYCKNKLFGKAIFGAVATIFFGTSTFMAFYYKFTPTFDVYLTTLDDLYVSPFSRAPPYFVGVAIGYLISKKDIKMTKVINFFKFV